MILRRAAEVLDFGQPAAVTLPGVLHLIQDSEDPARHRGPADEGRA
jgi:hypothetical protein